MNMQILSADYSKSIKLVFGLVTFAAAFVLMETFQDLVQANFNKSSFYISESFLFSSFWWLFVPFLFAQCRLDQLKKSNSVFFKILLVTLPIFLHLLAFPALVWLISELFYYHTFEVAQTLEYCLSKHSLHLVLLYSVSPIFFIASRKFQLKQASIISEQEVCQPSYQNVFVVSEGGNRISLEINDIYFFSANSPYINIHHKTRKYLYSETLKSVMSKINDSEFVRIHKSTIVNLKQVQSYKSKLNGDYDLTLKDGTLLRISRNYASDFKVKFHQSHRYTPK